MTETNNRAVTTHVDWTLRGRRENPEGLAVGATPKGTVVASFGETSSGRTCLTGGTEGEREPGTEKRTRNNGPTGSTCDENGKLAVPRSSRKPRQEIERQTNKRQNTKTDAKTHLIKLLKTSDRDKSLKSSQRKRRVAPGSQSEGGSGCWGTRRGQRNGLAGPREAKTRRPRMLRPAKTPFEHKGK